MNQTDDELETWQRQWQVDGPPLPPRVEARAVADDRRYRHFAIGEYALSALLLGGSLAYALYADTIVALLLLAGIWGIGVPTLAFTVWNRRGVWRAAQSDGRAFVALALQRCRRGLRAVHVSYVVLAAVVAFNVAVFNGAFAPMPSGSKGIALTIAVAAAYLVVLVAVHRRARRRLAAYEAIARELDL